MTSALAIIIGRAGSVGLPGKNAMVIGGRPAICHSIDHARAARHVSRVVVSTDGAEIAAAAQRMGVRVIDRPAELARSNSSVIDAVRHAVATVGGDEPLIVILYANVPVRPADLIDRAIERMLDTGADSVQSYCPVGKMHPYWMSELGNDGEVRAHVENSIDRRQDLPPLHVPDGGVIVARRTLITQPANNPHSFFGARRYGIVTEAGDVIDIDSPADAAVAQARLQLPARRFQIAGRPIGADQPPYIIAEIGVNHDGDPQRAIDLVDAAADAGADAVKVQVFTAEALLSTDAQLATYQRDAGASDVHTMLQRLELSREAYEQVVARARRRDIHAIATVFSVDLVAQFAAMGWEALKVASPDIVHRPLIEAMIRTGLPVIVSTGASTEDEVRRAVQWIESAAPDPVYAMLHCVSAYPVADADASLGGIAAVQRLTGAPVGYSDHTTSLDTGALAVMAGATILERHLTHDRTATGPDHAASLDPDAFGEYVRLAHRASTMRGETSKDVRPCEQDVRSGSRQSIVAVRALRAGECLTNVDVTIKRPGTGLTPDLIDEVIGRAMQRDVAAGQPLRPGDIELPADQNSR